MVSRFSRTPLFWVICAILLIFVAAGVGLYACFSPGFLSVEPHDEYRLVLGAEYVNVPVIVEEKDVLVPVEAVKKYLDPTLFWEPGDGRLTVTTKDRVMQMNTDQLTAYINRREIQLDVPVTERNGNPYMPLLLFEDFYDIQVEVHHHTRVVVIDRVEIPYMRAAAGRAVAVRTQPSFRAPRVVTLEPDEFVRVFRDDGGWYHLRTEGGQLGYAHKMSIQITGADVVKAPEKEPERKSPWKPMGERICLVWEHVVNENPLPETLRPMPGVNVVSPTWFSLRDEEGNLNNRADPAYVQWAHEQGYQVWALVSNSFDRDLSAAVLRVGEKRQKIIDQLLAFSELYHLDGINVDFENMYLEDRDYFTQFMREFAPLAREQGLVLSVDVTIKSSSEHWSRIYDRRALAEIVDYVMLMAYDEHWGTSPVAGSVASLPWVERGLRGVLEEVPPEKLLLGVPFYTRLWEIEHLEGGAENVSSRAYGMDRIHRILQEHDAEIVFCEKTGQHYANYHSQGKEYRVWLEDEESLASRLKIVEQYNLAGVAAWRRGFESADIWALFEDKLNP